MKKEFIEKLIIVLIILAILQIFLDEFSRYEHWSVLARKNLTLAGLFFDIAFSIEFIVRIIFAFKKNKASQYMKHERGWIDFLSSFPLLLLDLPAVYLLLSGNPEQAAVSSVFQSVLAIIKDLKITRILRFIRILKIFGKYPKPASTMTKHHTTVISTTVVFTIICLLAFFSLFNSPITHRISERAHFFDESISTIKYLENKSKISYKNVAKKMYSEEKNLLKLSYKDEIIISRISDEKFEEYFTKEDYSAVYNREFILYYSLVDLNREEAYYNIIYFFIVLFAFFSVIFIYARHFVHTVSSVISIIIMGFRSKQYNQQAKIRDEFEQDEVYKLAKFYNDIYLPAKLKRVNTGEPNIKTDQI